MDWLFNQQLPKLQYSDPHVEPLTLVHWRKIWKSKFPKSNNNNNISTSHIKLLPFEGKRIL